MSLLEIPDHLTCKLNDYGFVRIGARLLSDLVGSEAMMEWPDFRASWETLPLDEYMADGGAYRRRRFAVFLIGPNFVWRRAHRPHYQDRAHNPLNGGIARWFAPIADSFTNGVLINELLRTARMMLRAEGAVGLWYVEMHQFRIEARSDRPGLPTPEGLHRDGVDWVFIIAINRSGITGGVSRIHALDGTKIKSFTLERPLEAILLNDRRVLHDVTPIHLHQGARAGHRDVLVLSFKRTTEWNP